MCCRTSFDFPCCPASAKVAIPMTQLPCTLFTVGVCCCFLSAQCACLALLLSKVMAELIANYKDLLKVPPAL